MSKTTNILKSIIEQKLFRIMILTRCHFLGANRTEDLLVARNEIMSSYYYFFFLLDFSKTTGRIFMIFSGMVYIGLEKSKIIFRVMASLPVGDIDDFLILRVSFCAEMISVTT